jgi:hypothetical protein
MVCGATCAAESAAYQWCVLQAFKLRLLLANGVFCKLKLRLLLANGVFCKLKLRLLLTNGVFCKLSRCDGCLPIGVFFQAVGMLTKLHFMACRYASGVADVVVVLIH